MHPELNSSVRALESMERASRTVETSQPFEESFMNPYIVRKSWGQDRIQITKQDIGVVENRHSAFRFNMTATIVEKWRGQTVGSGRYPDGQRRWCFLGPSVRECLTDFLGISDGYRNNGISLTSRNTVSVTAHQRGAEIWNLVTCL